MRSLPLSTLDSKNETVPLPGLVLALSLLAGLAFLLNALAPFSAGYSLDALFSGEIFASRVNIGSDYPENTALELEEPLVLPETGASNILVLVTHTPTPTPEPTPEPKAAGGKFMLIGDSMMLVGFGPVLESTLLGYQNFSVVRLGKYSTGLNRTDYYDWYVKTREAITREKPDYLMVMFGANDGQTIRDSGGRSYALYSEGWKTTYTRRVSDYLNQVSGKVKRVYWIGHGNTSNTDFYRKFTLMNPIYETECSRVPNCVFIDIWDRFSKDGKFAALITDKNGKTATVKGGDGVHVTTHGGYIMTEEVVKALETDFELLPK